MTKKIIYLIGLFMIANHVLMAQEIYQFTLEQAQQYAIENSYKSRLAEFDVLESEYTVKETMSIGFPQIDGDASYNNNIILPVQVVPAEFFGGEEGEFLPVTFGTQHSVSANLSASQLIFDGSYLVGLKGAKVFNRLKQQQKGATDYEVKKNAADAYYTAVVAIENARMLQANFDEVDKQLKETQALYDNGFVEEQNVQQLELNLGKIEIAAENAKRQVEISRNLLKYQLGIALVDSIFMVDDLESLVEKAKVDVAYRYSYDVKNNVQYKVADTWVELRDTQIKLERAAFMPSLYLFFNQNWSSYENTFNYLNGGSQWFDATLLGLTLNVPIFSSFKRSAALQKAKVVSQKALIEREQLEAGLQLDLSVANSNFNQAFASYEISLRNVDVATSIQYKTNRKFQEGLATSFEVTQATSQLINDQFDYVESALRLFEAKTKIDELLNN